MIEKEIIETLEHWEAYFSVDYPELHKLVKDIIRTLNLIDKLSVSKSEKYTRLLSEYINYIQKINSVPFHCSLTNDNEIYKYIETILETMLQSLKQILDEVMEENLKHLQDLADEILS